MCTSLFFDPRLENPVCLRDPLSGTSTHTHTRTGGGGAARPPVQKWGTGGSRLISAHLSYLWATLCCHRSAVTGLVLAPFRENGGHKMGLIIL